MIVRQFISWVRNASAGERAEATRSLARAWLISDLSEDDRAAAEGALLMLLDDPSPLVRRAMAEVFSRSTDAPRPIEPMRPTTRIRSTKPMSGVTSRHSVPRRPLRDRRSPSR